jgi:hypothetical protein
MESEYLHFQKMSTKNARFHLLRSVPGQLGLAKIIGPKIETITEITQAWA